MSSAVALIPARAGSERVPGKNVRELGGHPLLAYAIAAAAEAGTFDAIVVSTDSSEIADIATAYGAEVPGLRPPELATSTSPDIDWVMHTIGELEAAGRAFEMFAILRPTSPFRSAGTIQRAFAQLQELGTDADSIRAVRLCREHPGKMWTLGEGDLMQPLLEQSGDGVPTHSRQYKDLPAVYIQDSSLELAWTRVLAAPSPSIAGERVAPFLTSEAEGFSIDYPSDWLEAERLLEATQGVPAPIPVASR